MTKTFKQMNTSDENSLMIVDSLNLAFRYKHSGAIGFCTDYMRTVDSLKKSYKSNKLIIAGDMGSSSYRKALYPDYKQNRKDKYAEQTFIRNLQSIREDDRRAVMNYISEGLGEV